MPTFEFKTKDCLTIEHYSGMLFEVLFNPTDLDYDVLDDVYQEYFFRGNRIIVKLTNDYNFAPEPMPVGYQLINAINKKAFKFYKAHRHVPIRKLEKGVDEDQQYILQQSEDKKGWVLTDKEEGYIIVFDDKKFNDTQKITSLNKEDSENFMAIAKILRLAGEWLVKNHSNKI